MPDEAVQEPAKSKRGGPRIGPDGKSLAGRRKGRKNKKTIERELVEQQKAQALEAVKQIGDGTPAPVAAAQVKKLGKEVLEDFMHLFAGMAAYHQPVPNGMPVPANRQPDVAKFLQFSELTLAFAKELTPYQSPRLAAMMIGQAQTRQIAVTGGLPSADAPPALTDEQYKAALKVTEGPIIEGTAVSAPELAPTAK